MRIISKFRDYYDSAMAMGVDMTRVYNRTAVVHDHSVISMDMNMYVECYMWKFDESTPMQHKWMYRRNTHSEGLLLVAGVAYDVVKIGTESGWSIVKDGESISNDKEKKFYKLNIARSYHKEGYKSASDLTEKQIHKIHRECGSPIILITRGGILTNICLKDFNLQKIVDPFTIFQEIDMYISNYLVHDLNPPSTPMSEKEKVVSKGFDDTYGFRTRPKGNK